MDGMIVPSTTGEICAFVLADRTGPADRATRTRWVVAGRCRVETVRALSFGGAIGRVVCGTGRTTDPPLTLCPLFLGNIKLPLRPPPVLLRHYAAIDQMGDPYPRMQHILNFLPLPQRQVAFLALRSRRLGPLPLL